MSATVELRSTMTTRRAVVASLLALTAVACAIPRSASAAPLSPEARAYRTVLASARADLRSSQVEMDRAERDVRVKLKACGPVLKPWPGASLRVLETVLWRGLLPSVVWIYGARAQAASSALDKYEVSLAALPTGKTLAGTVVKAARADLQMYREAPALPADACTQLASHTKSRFKYTPPDIAAAYSWADSQSNPPSEDEWGIEMRSWEALLSAHDLQLWTIDDALKPTTTDAQLMSLLNRLIGPCWGVRLSPRCRAAFG